MSVFRLAFLETLKDSVPHESLRLLADRYEERLADYAAGKSRYIKQRKIIPSQACVDAAHSMRANNISVRSIAKHFRVSCWTVRKWLAIRESNLPPT